MLTEDVEVLGPGHRDVERVRTHAGDHFSNLYTGWKPCVDREFDPHSWFFVLKEQGSEDIRVCCRIVLKVVSNEAHHLPVERGELSPGVQFEVPGKPEEVCEGGSFAYSRDDGEGRSAVVNRILSWAKGRALKRIFTSFPIGVPDELRDKGLDRGPYYEELGFTRLAGAVVTYPGVVCSESGSLVRWQVAALYLD